MADFEGVDVRHAPCHITCQQQQRTLDMRVVGEDRHEGGGMGQASWHMQQARSAWQLSQAGQRPPPPHTAPPHHIRLASPRHVEDTSTKGGCQVSSVTQLLHGGGGHVMFMAGGWQ